MLRGSVVSGAAFRTAALSLAIFTCALVVTGYALHHLIGAAMYRELEEQIVEEAVLFQDIQARGGQKALVEVIARLEQPAIAGPRVAALFDEKGNRLAGNLSIAPTFVGWRTLTLDVLAPGTPGTAHLYVISAQASTLVVGRSTRLIHGMLEQLVFYLFLAGLAVVVISLPIGHLISRRVFVKLDRLSATLDAVSKGDMRARVALDASNDQVDRVSRKINTHLDHLAALMGSTRNAINAIAHDLRSPLNRTYLRLQEALGKQGMDFETESLIEGAGAELKTISEIMDTILRIARIESGSGQEQFSTLSLRDLATDIADVLRPVAEQAGQELICDLAESAVPPVRGDAKMLRQMLVNLVENAICHCPAGTRISLSVGETPQHGAVISVADTGPGIPEEYWQQVLEPFFRLDVSRSAPGSGLGLALVNAIVVRQGAMLTLEDNRPGLCVSVRFPPDPAGDAAGPDLS